MNSEAEKDIRNANRRKMEAEARELAKLREAVLTRKDMKGSASGKTKTEK